MKITVITATYNSAATVYDTLNSVCSQDYQDVEHIIIDGGSTDDTLAVVGNFPHVAKLVSERDNGLYEAMNKGLQLATGDVIGILNSDDVYADSTILSAVAALFNTSEADSVYGDLQYVSATNMEKVVRTWRSGKFRHSGFYYGWMPPHPSFFVRSRVYEKVGLFNTNLRTAADYEMMLRILFKHRFTTAYLPRVLVKMRTGGISNASIKNRIYANKEDRLAWKLNNLSPYFFTLYIKPLRKIFQYIIK